MLSAAGGAWQACEVPRTLRQGGAQPSTHSDEQEQGLTIEVRTKVGFWLD